MTSISTSASVVIPRPRDEVFLHATDSSNAPEVLRARGPFAGVASIELHEGHTLQKGALRDVIMTDGTVIEETIFEYDPPMRHAYGWTGGLKPPFSWVIRSGGGNWDFTEVDGGTRIVWTYTFGLTSPLAYPLVLPLAWLFKGWLQQGLDAIRANILA